MGVDVPGSHRAGNLEAIGQEEPCLCSTGKFDGLTLLPSYPRVPRKVPFVDAGATNTVCV